MNNPMETYDVGVIGAGHAGCEAALACARLGVKTVLLTLNLDALANMPCNPSIGGTAKGHLVREIDALGGEMGKAADATFLQSRMLNRGKGPAVHSLRVQSDRRQYHVYMKQTLEGQKNLSLKQAEIVGIQTQQGRLTHLVTRLGMLYAVKAAIICVGTYQNAMIHVGNVCYSSGPDHLLPSRGLIEDLSQYGVTIRRFKTGTPARVHRNSIDFTKLEVQQGDDPITPFSFETIQSGQRLKNTSCCYIAYTNEQTHDIIRRSLSRSPIYSGSGQIAGAGPRYCPSIEDKVVRFSDKKRHQIFVEPIGKDTDEIYLQGMSSSLPEDVQLAFLKSIQGFEQVEIMRNAYAIEYDCFDPTQLYPTLELKSITGLYGAGQVNGTSGYEEAAAQGLIAGINAAHQIIGKQPIILDRASSYIGTLIDDLVVKGCSDPYRMLTSRSEYRLVLRQDNADLRLTKMGYEIGLISDQRYQLFCQKKQQMEQEILRVKKTTISPCDQLNQLLVSRGTSEINTGMKYADLLRRPQICYQDLMPFDPDNPYLPNVVSEQVEIEIKYEGYLKKQMAQVQEMRKLETRKLPSNINYQRITGLRLEAREKLEKLRPQNIGQASRISGVTPADISVLLIWLQQHARRLEQD